MSSKDERWASFATDPKFRPVPKKDRKVVIDKRFSAMFKDKRFVSKTAVDKRGRPARTKSSSEDYKRYYKMEDSDQDDDDEGEHDEEDEDGSTSSQEDDSSEEEAESGWGRPREREEVFTASSNDSSFSSGNIAAEEELKEQEVVEEPPKQSSPVAEEACNPKLKGKLRDLSVNYARGEGVLADSSSSSDDDSSDSEAEDDDEEGDVEEEAQFDKWGELDHDADRTEESTARLAVCNMDWDRVDVKDIFLVLSSFCPVGGNVKAVRVFTSEFGKKRLEEEDRLGPEELRARDEKEAEEEMEDELGRPQDQEEAERRAMEKVRRYQVNRLKYFYAVAEFDSASSALHVYQECDGKEYELSATRFDLRFVPDDMRFEDEPTSDCTSLPLASDYKPKSFTTSALQLGKVQLTWDETDPERTAAMKRTFEVGSSDEDEDGEANRFIGEADDDEGSDAGEAAIESGSEGEGGEGDAIAKYKSLLGDLKGMEKRKKKAPWDSDSENEEDGGGNMEMVFEDDEPVKKAKQKGSASDLTPWEQYLQKKRDKKKRRAKEVKGGEEGTEEAGDDAFDDAFFNDEGHGEELSKNQKQKKKKERRMAKEKSEAEAERSDLALVTMGSDDEKEHFDFKDIVRKESKAGKKKRKGRKAAAESGEKEADFSLDLADGRFEAIFENPDFNVDPSHPSFKKTNSMHRIIGEKQRRILSRDEDGGAAERAGGKKVKRGAQAQEEASLSAKKKKRKEAVPRAEDSTIEKLVTSVRAKSKKGSLKGK